MMFANLVDVSINDTNKAIMLRIGIFVLYISKVTKRTLILSSKKQTNHKLIIIKGKKTRILSKEPKEPTNHILAKGTKRTRTD